MLPIRPGNTRRKMNQTQFDQLLQTIAQSLREAGETILVRPQIFRGKESEDPEKWIEAFIRIARANNWSERRWIDIAGGFLEEIAADWFRDNKRTFGQWYITGRGDNFTELFIERFTSPMLKDQWHMQYLTLRQGTKTIDQFAHKFRELKRKVDPTNATLQEWVVRDFLLRLNPKIRVLASVAKPATLDDAIIATKNIEAALLFTQSYHSTTPVNKPERIWDNKGKRISRRRCYGCKKKGHEIKDCPNSLSYDKPLEHEEKESYSVNYVDIEYAESLSENLMNNYEESQEETFITPIVSQNTLTLDLSGPQEVRSVKEPKYVEEFSSKGDIYEEILLLYEDIVVEGPTTSSNSSTNTYASMREREGVLANVPLKTSERVKESLYTIPVKQHCNYIEECVVLQQQMQEEFQWKKKRKLKQLEF